MAVIIRPDLHSLTSQTTAAEHAERLERWLLSDDVILSGPPSLAGGIINYRDADGNWDGVYPEICGYHLQFAARAASAPGASNAGDYHNAATRVIAWLAAEGHAGAPLTLVRRDARLGATDWRNRCLFAFDIAIILRGLGSAEAQWPGIVPTEVTDRYIASVEAITADGRLASHVIRPDGPAVEVPVKWSTTQGVHHVKAAAALAGLSRPQLISIALATAQDEASQLDQEGFGRMRELHPFLYLIEGWLTLWGQTGDDVYLRRAGDAFSVVCGEFDPATAELPPTRGAKDAPVRADVLAQALRAGLVLDAAGQMDEAAAAAWANMRQGLYCALVARITRAGGVEFDSVRRDQNTWVSIFAWQAFRFWGESQARKLDASAAALALI